MPDPVSLRLFAPPPIERGAGGDRFATQLIEALRARGVDAVRVPVAGRHPVPDQAARDAAGQAWRQLPPRAVAVIDALVLPAFAECLPDHAAVGLFHHVSPLHNDLDPAAREAVAPLRHRAMARLRGIVTSNALTRERLIEQDGVPAARTIVVPPGLPDWPRAEGSDSGTCQLLGVGALVPRKGHDRLLRAVARLFDLDWHLTIIGTPHRRPDHAAELLALAEALGIAPRVTFAGDLDDAAREAAWRRADIFTLATTWEASGLAAAEALRRGIPAAVTAGGAAAATITPACGVVADVDDMENFSKSLRRLVYSAELRRHFADAAWAAGQALPGWAEQAAAFLAALDTLAAPLPARP